MLHQAGDLAECLATNIAPVRDVRNRDLGFHPSKLQLWSVAEHAVSSLVSTDKAVDTLPGLVLALATVAGSRLYVSHGTVREMPKATNISEITSTCGQSEISCKKTLDIFFDCI